MKKILYTLLLFLVLVKQVNADGCTDGPITFLQNCGLTVCMNTGSISDQPPDTDYTWDFGDGTTYFYSGHSESPCHTYTTPGTYNITLTVVCHGCGFFFTDKTCTGTGTVNVVATSAPVVSLVPTDPTCGQSNGSITANATGGSGTYNYSWAPGGEFTQTVSGLGAGTYSVTVTDGMGCSTIEDIALSSSVGPSATSSGINPSCGASNGSVSVNVIGGTGTLTYSWSPGGQAASSVNGLPAGTYVATITDGSGCIVTESVTITNPNSPTATSSATPSACSIANGSATVSASGGTGTLTYNWTPGGQTNPTATGLAAGTYVATIIDANGCSVTETVTVTSPAPTATIAGTNPTCGLSNGSATVTPAGGTAPLTYSWAPSGQTIPTATGLASGTYVATVTDAGGCATTQTVSIAGANAPIPVATGTNATCNAPNGSATVTVTGGTGPYAYNWTPGGLTTPTIAGLAAGNYTITVTDAVPCSAIQTVTILNSNAPTAAFTSNQPCMGDIVSLTDGSISPGGDPIVAWDWSMPGGTPATSINQNPTTVYNTAGSLTVTLTVTTQQGCISIYPQQVLVYTPPVAIFSGSDSGCVPLCVTSFLDASTSVDGNISNWDWSFPGGTPSSSSSQNPGTICYNDAGDYGASLTVTTNYGCKNTLSITPLVSAYGFPTGDFCISPDNQAPATDPVFSFCDMWPASSSVSSWYWDFGDGSPIDSVNTDPIHSYSATTTNNDFSSYTVKLILKNQFGCPDTITKTVELIPEFTFFIPNSFTPNQDPTNEYFFGKGRGISEYNIWIFDRWGNMIWDCHYSGKNTDWDGPGEDGMPSACKWDGIVIGSEKLVQEDVFNWKVQLTDVFKKKHNYTGRVTMVK